MALIKKVIGVTDSDGHKITVQEDKIYGTAILLSCEHHGDIALDRDSADVLASLIKDKLKELKEVK